jgi:hypothetical protein
VVFSDAKQMSTALYSLLKKQEFTLKTSWIDEASFKSLTMPVNTLPELPIACAVFGLRIQYLLSLHVGVFSASDIESFCLNSKRESVWLEGWDDVWLE